MRQRSFMALGSAGFHRVAYTEWGDSNAERVLVCVHGLIRNARDFDPLAAALAETGWRVVCPDVPGRGESEPLAEIRHYEVPAYCSILTNLIARLDVGAVDWLGTSMGGLIGMAMAAQANTPIRRLILNDVGAFVPMAALDRIRSYVGIRMRFPDLGAVEAYLRETYRGFAPLSDAQWRHLAEHAARREADGTLLMRYDSRIGDAMRAKPLEDADLWTLWENIRVPVLLLRGGKSDVLPAAVADAMTTRGPGCELVTFPEHGHAPPLMSAAQIGVVREWLGR